MARPVSPPPPPAPVAAPPPAAVGIAPVVTPPGATRPTASSEAFAADAISAVPIIEIAAPEPSRGLRTVVQGGSAAGRGGGAAANALSQISGATRWRILGGTRVERTTDGGATWTALPIEPVLTTPLVAGAATSQSNCWMVGRNGVVLVATDGRTFRRVSVPEAVHLTGVTATDSLRATVTAIDGRTFSTTDGGLTWK
ncbi:MAG TPA: hypothetical protein VMZ90_10965 [Vicinamibacterales bacterium]|nr:hypothetical protein [Vicinamibacterales bacterium]